MPIATRCGTAHVRRLLDVLLAELSAELAVPRGVLSGSVGDVASPVSAGLYAELLGTPATCRVILHVDNKATDDDGYFAAYPALAVAAVRLSDAVDAEACLTYELDRVVMRRRGGRLELFDWFRPWGDPAVLERVPRPFVVTPQDGRL